jgi:hypothetical protein
LYYWFSSVSSFFLNNIQFLHCSLPFVSSEPNQDVGSTLSQQEEELRHEYEEEQRRGKLNKSRKKKKINYESIDTSLEPFHLGVVSACHQSMHKKGGPMD